MAAWARGSALPEHKDTDASTSNSATPVARRDPPTWWPTVYGDTSKVLLSGGFAGAVSKSATAPLARLTILLQVQGLAVVRQEPRTPSLFRALSTVVKQEGFLSLWKGNGVTIVHRLPYSAVNFWTYEQVLQRLRKRSAASTEPAGRSKGLLPADIFARLVAGASAGASACTLAYPLDLVRTRLAAQTSSTYYRGIGGTLRTIVRDEGLAGLYRGLGPTLLQTVPSLAFNYCAYETLRSRWLSLAGGDLPSVNQQVVMSLVCGSLAGLASSTATFPLDLVRRRLQLEGRGGTQHRYGGYLDVFRTVVRERGMRGLYCGIVPDYCKVVPGVAITFCMYELGKRTLGVTTNQKDR